ncbi:MAG: 4Fe-4S single cluster domain-containing protein [Sphaerochaetaceae bacterium]|nr:4Fe-4S single cluster domain-containing protein [Sphaerochaetaceae bacterium]
MTVEAAEALLTTLDPSMEKMELAGFIDDSITDGPGLRLAIFAQGCPHRCPGCQNPTTWNRGGGRVFTVAQVVDRVAANRLVKGVTFSGGDPFFQPRPFALLARSLRAAGYEVACYTGWTFEQLLASGDPYVRALLRMLDVLVDGPYVQALGSYGLKFKGSSNQRTLDVQKSLQTGGAALMPVGRWN